MTGSLQATRSAVPAAARPRVNPIQQWWVLTVRMIIPTLRNGELATQIIGSMVFTIGYYLPLKEMMGQVQPLSSYAQYLTPLIILQAEENKTVTLIVSSLSFAYVPDYGVIMISAVFATLPTVLIFFLLQRRFVEGLLGSVK